MKFALAIVILLVLSIGGLLGGVYFRPRLVQLGYCQADWGAKTKTTTLVAHSAHETPAAVTALGRLEPESQIIDVAAETGIRVARIVVSDGALVNRGDPLAYCDSYDELAAARDLVSSKLVEARNLYAAETDYDQSALEVVTVHLKQDDQSTQRLIEAQQATVRSSQAMLEKAKKDVGRSNSLSTDQAMSQSDRDKFTLALRQGEELVSHDQSVLTEMQEGRILQLQADAAAVREARAALARAQASIPIDSLAQDLKVATAHLDRSVIRAPIDGEIVKVVMHPGEVSGRNPILKMGNTSAMFATAEVYETDVRFLREGMRAEITSKAFPDRLEGRVERIGILVFKNDVLNVDPTAETDRRIIEVRIRLENSDVARRYNHHQIDVAIPLEPGQSSIRAATTQPIPMVGK